MHTDLQRCIKSQSHRHKQTRIHYLHDINTCNTRKTHSYKCQTQSYTITHTCTYHKPYATGTGHPVGYIIDSQTIHTFKNRIDEHFTIQTHTHTKHYASYIAGKGRIL